MEIKSIKKCRTYKSAHVMGTDKKDSAFNFALTYFRESKSSLFGWAVMPIEGGFKVVLYTD